MEPLNQMYKYVLVAAYNCTYIGHFGDYGSSVASICFSKSTIFFLSTQTTHSHLTLGSKQKRMSDCKCWQYQLANKVKDVTFDYCLSLYLWLCIHCL